MKKLLFLCIIILSPALCFSQGKYGDFEFSVGMPFSYGWLDENGRKDTVSTDIPFSFGMGGTNYNVFGNSNLGIAFTANIIFPGTLEHTAEGQANRYGSNDDITVVDLQFGLGYHLLGKEKAFRVPITFGLHFLYITGILKSSPTVTQEFNSISLGLGVSAAAEIHINSWVYFFARLQGFFDFLTIANHITYTGVNVGGRMAYFIDGREYGVFSLYVGIAPVIGIGIKVDGILDNANK